MGRRLSVVRPRCDPSGTARTGFRAIAIYAGVILCVIAAGLLYAKLSEGGTVRSAETAVDTRPPTADQTAAFTSKPGRKHVPRPGISIAAVGDTMLGNTPELPSDPGPTSTT